MNPDGVPSKTQKGTDEIATRKNKLEARVRAVLIMVNGKTTAAQLSQKFGGDVTPLLQQLLAQGFIQETAA